jgi:hypothetical protein
MKKIITNIKEYDGEGKLVKETTTTETFDDTIYPQVVPFYPSYPIPIQPYYTTITV